MKKILLAFFVATYFSSCDKFQNYTEQVPKCNDSIPVKLTEDIVRQSIAGYIIAEFPNNYGKQCYEMIKDYKSGKKFDEKTNEQIVNAIAKADTIDFKIENILPSDINEELKKCDCEATLTFKERKTPIFYSVQNTEEGTYVTLKNY